VHFTEYDTRLAAYALLLDDGALSGDRSSGTQVLLTWYNAVNRGGRGAAWSLPGGGVEYDETLVDAVVREVHEESGYHVDVGAPLTTNSFTAPDGPRPPRPYKSVRVIFEATITGGTLGTVEVGGTTDRAAWLPVADLASAGPRADIVDVALAAAGHTVPDTPRHAQRTR